MPLSDEELRLLEQMERAISAEDPRFASVLAGDFRRGGRIRLAIAVTVFVLGVGLLVGGVVTSFVWVGIGGFVVMVLAGTAAVTLWRGVPVRTRAGRPRRPRQAAPKAAFMQRVEARWLRRRHRWG